MIIATHNLMHGLRLRALIRHYRQLQERRGLDVLCVQENRSRAEAHSPLIAEALGGDYAELSAPRQCGKGIVYNTRSLRCESHELVPLPRLERLSWFERRYIAGGAPDQRFVQIARFSPAQGQPFQVVNFHLDTAGGNGHRRRQVQAIAELLARNCERALVCGDTNAFSIRRKRQQQLLAWMMEPLAPLGMTVADNPRPTHFFARQDEPKLSHQVVRAVARAGFDWPRRYDVVCTNMEVEERGVESTPESDHDLVWALLRRRQPARAP